MARRIELGDVGDGITGHILWSIGAIGFPDEDELGAEYRFDLIEGLADPTSKGLRRVADSLRSDLARHLAARKLPADWVASATLTITFGEVTQRDESLVTCRVEIVDDRGRLRTSTRRGGVWRPPRRRMLPLARLLSRRNGVKR